MSFLVPLFLLGLAAIAVPIWIHLTHREKDTTVPFPSLMFLRKIPYKEVRRRRLRHLFLLSLRSLAIALVAFAFARPFFDRASAEAAPNLGPREMVVLIDNSLSMAYDGRLERAKQEAQAVVNGLSPQDRVSVVVFSDTVEVLNEPLEGGEAAQSIIDDIELSAGRTRFAPALKVARRILDDSELLRKAVVLVSDYQRIGWEDDQDAWLGADTEFMSVSVAADAPENVSIADMALERERVDGRERLKASVRLTRTADLEADPVDASLSMELSGRVLQSKDITLGANQAGIVNFDPFTVPEGISRGIVRLSPDKLASDDVFHFVLWPGQSIRVLVVTGPGGSSRRNLYIRRALAIGERPSYNVEYKTLARLNRSDLESVDVAVLVDSGELSGAQEAALSGFVGEGGGLIFVSGPNGRRLAGDLLPGDVKSRKDRTAELGGTLAFIDYSHPLFELFRAPQSGDFSSSRFFRYLELDESSGATVLARFDDGAPALLEKSVGDGRVLFWTSTLDTFWNDLSRQPVFLPFLHEMVKYAAGHSAADSWQRVGDVTDLRRYVELAERDTERADSELSELVITTPEGERAPLEVADGRALLQVSELGFYELRRSSGVDVYPLAVNVDLAESDLSSMDPEELAAAVVSGVGADGTPAVATELTLEERERRQSGWWYLLVLAFVLFVAETLMSNRLSQARG